jgi:hypothetical protein
MAQPKDFTKLVSEAEAAVASVKDAELRQIAFSKILEELLSDAPTSPSHKSVATKGPVGAAKPASKPHRRGPQGYIEEMIEEDFFGVQRTLSQVQAELGNRGHHIPRTSLSGPLQKLCQAKKLRRAKGKLPGMRSIKYTYSNW